MLSRTTTCQARAEVAVTLQAAVVPLAGETRSPILRRQAGLPLWLGGTGIRELSD